MLNLKPFQKGKIYLSEKKGNNATAKKVAATFGIGEKTVRNAAKFVKAFEIVQEETPDVAEKILFDQVSDALSELPKLAKDPDMLIAAAKKLSDGKAKKIKEAVRIVKTERRNDRLAEREEMAKRIEGPDFRLLCGDVLEAGKKIPDKSVHAIITDPPYGRAYLDLYSRLGELAARVLIDGGVCLVMTGQAHLGEVIARLNEHLIYVWTLAYLTPGASVQVFNRRIKSNWKPVLYYTKGSLAWEHINDVFRSNERDKRFHAWGQSELGMAQIVEAFTVPGQIILDPFCGAGTVGVAALSLQRRFIGIDIDEQCIANAETRLVRILASLKE